MKIVETFHYGNEFKQREFDLMGYRYPCVNHAEEISDLASWLVKSPNFGADTERHAETLAYLLYTHRQRLELGCVTLSVED